MISLLVDLVVTWMFLYGLVAPLQGPVARALNGLDLSWLAGMLTAGLLYYGLNRLGVAPGETIPGRRSANPPARRDETCPAGEVPKTASDRRSVNGTAGRPAPPRVPLRGMREEKHGTLRILCRGRPGEGIR
jgi:hypothetical protein